jgi:putative ABC transport system permease protein
MFNELLDSGDVMDSYDTGSVLDKATVMNYTKPMSSELNAELRKVLNGNTSSYRLAYNDYSEGLMIFGLVRFIGFFMSAVVILMTASMLYFKQIMAAEEEQHLFRMLRKVGMDEGMQKKVITKRLLPVFFIPLAVGIVHSIFAMKSADTLVFDNMILSGDSYITVLGYSAVMYVAYAVVYAIFYLLTKSQYTKTIKG